MTSTRMPWMLLALVGCAQAPPTPRADSPAVVVSHVPGDRIVGFVVAESVGHRSVQDDFVAPEVLVQAGFVAHRYWLDFFEATTPFPGLDDCSIVTGRMNESQSDPVDNGELSIRWTWGQHTLDYTEGGYDVLASSELYGHTLEVRADGQYPLDVSLRAPVGPLRVSAPSSASGRLDPAVPVQWEPLAGVETVQLHVAIGTGGTSVMAECELRNDGEFLLPSALFDGVERRPVEVFLSLVAGSTQYVPVGNGYYVGMTARSSYGGSWYVE